MAVGTNVKVYVACAGVLYAKFLLLTMIQGGKTFAAGGRPPEDAALSVAKQYNVKQSFGMKFDPRDEKLAKAREEETRWRRMTLNDLESVSFALLVFIGGILADSNETVHFGAMITYTLARVMHSYAYAKQLQPHRSIFWLTGVTTTLVGVGNAIAGAFM